MIKINFTLEKTLVRLILDSVCLMLLGARIEECVIIVLLCFYKILTPMIIELASVFCLQHRQDFVDYISSIPRKSLINCHSYMFYK